MTRRLALVDGEASEDALALWSAYERRLVTERKSQRTIDGYRHYVLALAAHAGVALEDVTQAHVTGFLAAQAAGAQRARGPQAGGALVVAAYKALAAFYNWADRTELLAGRSPLHGIACPKADRKVVPVPATESIQAVLAVMDTRPYRGADPVKIRKHFEDRRDTAIIRLMCELGGLRRAEVAGIRREHLDLPRARVLVMGKGGKQRWVPFGARTGEALMRYLTVRKNHKLADSPMLWLGARGKPLTGDGIRQMIDRRTEQAGVGHMHPHMFRHYAAAQAKRNRVPGGIARALFGWDTSEMYDGVYARFADAEEAEQMAQQLAVGDQL